MGSAMTGDRRAPDVDPAVRRALPTEAAVLSSLALRSKSHWGYDVDFLAACRDDLTLSADDIATSVVYVFDGADAPSGFYRLVHQDDGMAELDALFVEPAAMGCSEMVWQSDPQAEGFYLAMGAQRAGASESTVMPGRMLPLMRFRLR